MPPVGVQFPGTSAVRPRRHARLNSLPKGIWVTAASALPRGTGAAGTEPTSSPRDAPPERRSPRVRPASAEPVRRPENAGLPAVPRHNHARLARDRSSTPSGRNSVVEWQLPKLQVEGSNPFARSNYFNNLGDSASAAQSGLAACVLISVLIRTPA